MNLQNLKRFLTQWDSRPVVTEIESGHVIEYTNESGQSVVMLVMGEQYRIVASMRARRMTSTPLHQPGLPLWHSEHPTLCCGDMTIHRMDNVLIVVDDLAAAKAFFAELGMELEGETPVEGRWVDRVVGLNDVRADIAMMRTPDGHSRLELTKFHTPPAVRAEPESAPANTLGIRRIMFAVDNIDDVVARLRSHGAELVGEIAQYEDIYRVCFLRGPEGIVIGLAEQLS
jgi:catechol 2,3-dioxygenase-like lactoylglutathione lyase family enzyme